MGKFLKLLFNARGESATAEPVETFEKTPPVSQRQIEERAYFLWREAGCPGGRDIHFWLRAEEELAPDKRR